MSAEVGSDRAAVAREGVSPSGKGTVGRCFIDPSGQIWEQIAFTDRPTASFRRMVRPSERLTGVIGSALLRGLSLLSEEDEGKFRLSLQTSAERSSPDSEPKP